MRGKTAIGIISVILIFYLSQTLIGSPKIIGSETDAPYGIDFWREADGLPQSRIRAILQTRDGYLWLGTDNGLVRFNGTSFTAFTTETGSLRDNEVWSLLEDKDGGLWIGTYGGGLTLYRNGQFTGFSESDGLTDDLVNKLDMDADGNIWMATGKGLFRFSDGVFTHFTGENGLDEIHINAICARSALGVLIAAGNKLYQFNGDRFTIMPGVINESDGVLEHLANGNNGSFWLSFSNAVIKKWQNGEITTYSRQHNLTPHITSIYEDNQGTLWTVLETGLNKLENERFNPVRLEAGAGKVGEIYSIFSDREGNIWLGLQANGLGRLRIKELTTISADDGVVNDSTRAVFEDSQKSLWIGTVGGFSIYRNGQFFRYDNFDGKPFDSVKSFAEDDSGNMWIAAGGALFLMNKSKLTKFPGWSPKSEIKALYKDPEGRMWIGTDGDGVFRFENDKFINIQVRDGLAGNNIRAILTDREGALWISCSGKGLSKYVDGKFTNYTTSDGLAGDRGLAIYEDDEGTLWFPTREGLSRLKDGKFFNYTSESGMQVGFIYTMLDDGKGNFWFSCANGLFRVSKAELKEFAEGQRKKVAFVDYGVHDGLKTRAFNVGNQPAAWKTSDGLLMFASLKGLVVVDPQRVLTNRVVPPVYIEEISINKEKHMLNDPPEIPVGSGELEIHFAALSFHSPEKLRFKYKLEGYDEDWVDAGSRRYAYYANLSPGQYKFRVTAGNIDGGWNEQGATFDFYLEPHFYQTRWFLAVIFMAVIMAAGLVYRLRVLGLKARYAAVLNERNRIALEIHDTLAQNLSGIALQLDSVKMKLGEIPVELRESIDKTYSLTRYSLSEARRAVADLKSDEFNERELAEVLPEIVRQMGANTKIRIDLQVTGTKRRLNPVTEKNLLRIFQEALANAIKHAEASNIVIELKYDNKGVILRVADDGKGFNIANIIPLSVGHYGLIGMRERAARCGGRLEIISSPGNGTQLQFELSYAAEADSPRNMRLQQ